MKNFWWEHDANSVIHIITTLPKNTKTCPGQNHLEHRCQASFRNQAKNCKKGAFKLQQNAVVQNSGNNYLQRIEESESNLQV